VLSFNIGMRPTLTATFRDIDGDLADPTAIVFRLRPPRGEVVEQTQAFATNVSTGVWEWQVPDALTLPGTWWVQALATEGLQTADEICFTVAKSKFAAPT
jgi:hypothetical protein